MVVKMMRWPPWPPLFSSRKYQVKIVVKRVKGVKFDNGDKKRLVVEIEWAGQKRGLKKSATKKMKKLTEEGGFCGDGVFEWNGEFIFYCNFSAHKDGLLYPWEVAFTVFDASNEEPKSSGLVGAVTLNISELASTSNHHHEIDVPLITSSSTTDHNPSLCLSLWLIELGSVQEAPRALPSSLQLLPPPSSEEAPLPQKEELSRLQASLRKVGIFRQTKKALQDEVSNDGKSSARETAAEYCSRFDLDSFDNDADAESEDNNGDSSPRLPFKYRTLASANFSWESGSLYDSSTMANPDDEGWIFYNNRRVDLVFHQVGQSTGTVHEQPSRQSSKRRISFWKKKTLNFRSAKRKVKEEPLLKKDYGENGGDDIDFDRRQLSTSDESNLEWDRLENSSMTGRSSFSEFGAGHFVVGTWELKEIISRDQEMKMNAKVFFASIDQRSERVAGESACTTLVAVIAHWLQCNPREAPTKSEFDSLIRDGSLEWRNLCENEDYIERFANKHFDLETILQAKIRPLSVVSEKSFVGFFHPKGLEGGDFDFLDSAMSLDDIWEEVSQSENDHAVYIVSWNDHFFALKIDRDAYYIVDTLGERLYEGCNQAYVLKFDKDTTIQRIIDTKDSDKNSTIENSERNLETSPKTNNTSEMKKMIVCQGKDSCKEYIKSFLAAIPIRELQADIKKGLVATTPIHHRLQIEFHYTNLTESALIPSKDELVSTIVA